MRAYSQYIRTITDVRPEWLLDFAPLYYSPENLDDGEVKRIMQGILSKRSGKGGAPDKKKRRQ